MIGEGLFEQVGRKLHEIRTFGPDERGANGSVGIKLLQYSAIGRELHDVGCRNLRDSAWGSAVGLEVRNQHLVFGHRKTIDLTGDQHPFAELSDDRHFGPAAWREQLGEILVVRPDATPRMTNASR